MALMALGKLLTHVSVNKNCTVIW